MGSASFALRAVHGRAGLIFAELANSIEVRHISTHPQFGAFHARAKYQNVSRIWGWPRRLRPDSTRMEEASRRPHRCAPAVLFGHPSGRCVAPVLKCPARPGPNGPKRSRFAACCRQFSTARSYSALIGTRGRDKSIFALGRLEKAITANVCVHLRRRQQNPTDRRGG